MSVPVLSNMTCVHSASDCSASGLTTNTPRRASRSIARAMTAGTASANAQGQEITSTATAAENARDGSIASQKAPAAAVNSSTRRTRRPARASPARTTCGRSDCARPTSATRHDSAVSAPTRSTRSCSGPSSSTLPAMSRSPTPRYRRGFAALQRFVDVYALTQQDAVGGHDGAFRDMHAVAHAQFFDRHAPACRLRAGDPQTAA